MEAFRELSSLPIGSGLQMTDLRTPETFVTTILQQIRLAQDRVVLSALYLGTGEHENAIVDALAEALSDPYRPNFTATLILDHSRTLRGGPSSVKMLASLVDRFHPRVTILLYQVPQLRSPLKSLIPCKFRELLGVYHCKFGVFDQRVILTGANLSHEYFTARQDRYFLIEPHINEGYHRELHQRDHECSATIHPVHPASDSAVAGSSNTIATYLTSFVGVVKKDSFQLLPGGEIKAEKGWNTADAKKQMQAELLGLSSKSISTSSADSAQTGTHIFPVLQHAALQITQESEVIARLGESTHSVASDVCIATPYANFRPHFLRSLVARAALPGSSLTLTVPTVPAHGFGSAKGLLRFVPALHHYALHVPLQRLLRRHDALPNVRLRYFMQPGCTYHSKGIWVFPRTEPSQVDAQSRPVVTYLGSSNFSERSWGRDFELGFLVATHDRALQDLLRREHASLQAHCGVAEGELTADAAPAPMHGAGMGTVPAAYLPQFRTWQQRGLYFVARVLRSIL
jgi:CDP-diacylglycerol--glycerol-3-phosphate 3-phosphatidyltransferase